MANKILVIDDEPDVLEVMRAFLQNAGFNAEAVLNAEVAWEKVQKTPPDLVLLDIMLPGKSGFQFCEELKESSFKRIPIVMVSAKTGAADIAKGLKCGADDYITKPIDFGKFVDRINNALEKQK